MKKLFLTLAILSLTMGMASVAFAAAFNTRPVTVLDNGYEDSLQEYLDGQAIAQNIDVALDQTPYALWKTSSSGNPTFTLMLELTAGAGTQAFGIYNDGDTGMLFEVFPGPADGPIGIVPGWYAAAHFNASGIQGKLVVNLFDGDGMSQGSQTYFGVNSRNFGFYLDSDGDDLDDNVADGDALFSEDDENGGTAYNLAYHADGTSGGLWWLAWEDGVDQDYQDLVVFAESINPVPEPTSLMLLGIGLGGGALGLRFRRRRG